MDSITSRVGETSQASRFKRRRRPLVILVVIVVVLVVASVVLWAKFQSNSTATINTSEYQAVDLTNSQVYFGKLLVLSNGDYKLTNVFYLQTDSTTTAANSKTPIQLIKLGSEIHGPEDAMIINKQQVLFYENLKPDGKVSQAIASYYQKN
jgi:hypothetical protein